MGKELTPETAKANFDAAKEESSARWADVQALRKKFKLKPGAKPEDKKDAKEYKNAVEAHQTAKKAKEAAEEAWKAVKPASNVARSTYDYPSDIVSAEDKKKYRAKMRAEKRKAEKGDGAPAKKSKKDKKAEKAAEETAAKVSKKDKKAKKSKAVDTDDED